MTPAKLSAEQIQSAIETAKRVASGAENGIGTRLCREFAYVVLELNGRLSEAEKERDDVLFNAAIQFAVLRAELTEARATICKCSENTADALRGRDEARKEIESVNEHAKAMENSSDSYRERLDEARKRLDVLDGCNQQWAAKSGDLQADLDEARRQLDIARKAIEDASHGGLCQFEDAPRCTHCDQRKKDHMDAAYPPFCPDARGRPETTKYEERPARQCNCWKSRALSQITPTETQTP